MGKVLAGMRRLSLGMRPFLLSASDATSQSRLIVGGDGGFSVGQPQCRDARLVLDDPQGRRQLSGYSCRVMVLGGGMRPGEGTLPGGWWLPGRGKVLAGMRPR
jgi:hypothetical protein